jgi:hypothetical protein
MISRAAIPRLLLLSTGEKEPEKAPLVYDTGSDHLPSGFDMFLKGLMEKPLFEAIENIILFFGLGRCSWNTAYINTFMDYVLAFTGNGNPGTQAFLDWWEQTGCRKSVVLPGNQDAMRILTIHKSKGLEFSIVILPFISWNLDHLPSKQPLLWVKPDVAPFNELGIVPVRCNKGLEGTIFSDYYHEERYSSYLDNLNLLYVAFTRAKDVLYGFSSNNPGKNSIGSILKEALSSGEGTSGFNLQKFYDAEKEVFEFGDIPPKSAINQSKPGMQSGEYIVTGSMESLRLKLHGENYFSSGNEEIRKKINYGKLMHEVFEGINSGSDIPNAVRRLVLEGKLPPDEAANIEGRIKLLISDPKVSEWFSPSNRILKEAGILLTSGNIRRPDRVIINNEKAIIVDFKFGEENDHYLEQVGLYRGLLLDMGYDKVEAFIWYVDKNKIVAA